MHIELIFSIFSLMFGIFMLNFRYPERNVWDYILLEPSAIGTQPFIAFWIGIGTGVVVIIRILIGNKA